VRGHGCSRPLSERSLIPSAACDQLDVEAIVSRTRWQGIWPIMSSSASCSRFWLRFIEQMPLDAQHEWDRHRLVDADAILASLRTAPTTLGVVPRPQSCGMSTAPHEGGRYCIGNQTVLR
jgi:molybdenum cofactor biosynthesis enzyme MoaA